MGHQGFYFIHREVFHVALHGTYRLLDVFALQNFSELFLSNLIVAVLDGLDDVQSLDSHILLFELIILSAVITHGFAVGLVEGLSEVPQLSHSSAGELVLAVIDHGLQVFRVVHLDLLVFLLGIHEIVSPFVPAVVVQDAVRYFPVSPGPPALLVVILNTLAEREMQHESDVGLVDAHSEGYGGDNDGHLVVHP